MPIIQPTGRRIDTINPTEEKYPVTYVNSKAYRAFCGEDFNLYTNTKGNTPQEHKEIQDKI